MNLRKTASLTAFLLFVIMLVTGIILFLTPQGRIANWADWRLLGMSKTDWGNIHINTGILFLLTGLLHIYYNWKPIVNYLKNKTRKVTVFTPDFNVALVIVVLTVLGSYFMFPPFSTVLDYNEELKADAAIKYGDPPYGHAELTPLRSFAKKMNFDLDESLARLQAAGIQVEDSGQQLLDIAARNGVSPQQVYLAMKPEPLKTAAASNAKPLPLEHPTGLGRQTLAVFCETYGLDTRQIAEGLRHRGIAAEPEMNFKEIGETIDSSPDAVFELIKDIAAGH